MALTLNKNTKILIDNFIDTHFKGENKDKVKEQTLEIIECVLEQNSPNLDNLATKGDIKSLQDDIKSLEIKMLESKYDLLKWIVTAQLGISGLLLALIKLI